MMIIIIFVIAAVTRAIEKNIWHRGVFGINQLQPKVDSTEINAHSSSI